MTVFRSPMEKILDKQENDIVVTNPKEPIRTFFRRIAYRLSVWTDRARRIFHRRSDGSSKHQ